jgi:hypothetical protein
VKWNWDSHGICFIIISLSLVKGLKHLPLWGVCTVFAVLQL